MFDRGTLEVYFFVAIGGVLLSVAIIVGVLVWPDAVPLILATLISAAVILAYIAWRITTAR